MADAYRLQAINTERYKAMALSSEPEVGEILSADIERTQNPVPRADGPAGHAPANACRASPAHRHT